MSEYAPGAIQNVYSTADELAPELGLQLSGIQGDSAHTYGYHRGRNYVGSDDYSVQLADDQKGDPDAACALDITPADTAGMIRMTQNMIDAVDRQDARIASCVREFYGTVDGVNVTGRDVRTGDWVSSDDSHLWHLHTSIIRRYSNDYDALAGVPDVMVGTGSGSGGNGDNDMGTFETTVCHQTQQLNNSWRAVKIDDSGSQSWFRGPCTFQAMVNLTVAGLPAGGAIKVRWYTVDVRTSDGYTRPDAVNVWPDIELIGTAGSSFGSVNQYGQIGTPDAGYQRRLRLQAYADQDAGVAISYTRASSFRQ